MSHRCPRKGCPACVPHGMLACRAHWRLVPIELQRQVRETWEESGRRGSDEHTAAVTAAVVAMNRGR